MADTFGHHVGRPASKEPIANVTYDGLFEKDKRLYEAKWGVTWMPHRHEQLQWERHHVMQAPARVS